MSVPKVWIQRLLAYGWEGMLLVYNKYNIWIEALVFGLCKAFSTQDTKRYPVNWCACVRVCVCVCEYEH